MTPESAGKSGRESARPWALVTFQSAGRERAGILREDGTVVAPPLLQPHAGALELLRNWAETEPALREIDPDDGDVIEEAELLAPIRFPNKVICAGANYRSHLEEMGVSLNGPPAPFFFLKPPSNTVIGPGASIRVPASGEAQVDWEAELAVVIGRRTRGATAAEAPDAVAGYMILNDLSARAAHRRDDPLAPPFEFDWLSSKGRDTFCPTGPGVTPSWFVDDPQQLRIRLWVNGELKQDGDTGDMLVGIWELIAAASGIMTLEPGDVIATGTPAGVGMPRGEFLGPDDEVAIEVERLGRLVNPVEAHEG